MNVSEAGHHVSISSIENTGCPSPRPVVFASLVLMKRIFSFQSKPKNAERLEPSVSTSTLPKLALSPTETSPTISRLPTRRSEGAIWQSLQVLSAEDGLYIKPAGESQYGYLKVAWQKTIKVTELKGPIEEFDWKSSSITVHGILGTMSLFSGASSEARSSLILMGCLQPPIFY